MRWAENGPQRPLADLSVLGKLHCFADSKSQCLWNSQPASPACTTSCLAAAGSPVERWGGEAGRGRGRGPPGPTPPRWGPPGPERHQHPDRWGAPIAPEARPREARDKWEKWGGFEGKPLRHRLPVAYQAFLHLLHQNNTTLHTHLLKHFSHTAILC